MPTLTYLSWRDVPANTWRWPNFSASEIACRGTGAIKINTEAMDKLQALRDRLGKPLIVRSAYRSPEHNRAVGGATRSKHLDGAAFDIAMTKPLTPIMWEKAPWVTKPRRGRTKTSSRRTHGIQSSMNFCMLSPETVLRFKLSGSQML